ncbi:MAG: hypothetical protein ACOH17_14235 [Cellulomonas sp.]
MAQQTGWPTRRVAMVLAVELADDPDAPTDVLVTNTLLAVWAEEFDEAAAALAVELEHGDVAMSRVKLQRAFGLWLVGRDPDPAQMLMGLRAIVVAVRGLHASARAA